MKILLTGGGTGGHFYPIIAVADALIEVAEQEKIAKLDLVFMAGDPYDKNILLQRGIKFKKIYSGKIRRYFSLLNIIDIFKSISGAIKALWSIYTDFPDVLFSKGGYESFPVVLASRILGIPIVIHESDTVPGRVNKWAGKFAKRVAISFSETSSFFPKNKTALVGNPVRKEFFMLSKTGAKDFFNIEEAAPTIFFIGGSQGAKIINDTLLDVLPELLKDFQIIHQCGKNNFKEVEGRASVVLENSPYKSRYHLYSFLDLSLLKMAYGASDLVVSRAGAGLFEIAASGLPSILIPLMNSAQDHQKKNAYTYASFGACNVIEQQNLSGHLLQSEIKIMLENKEKLKQMAEAAKKFAKPDAAEKIAREIINLVLEHA